MCDGFVISASPRYQVAYYNNCHSGGATKHRRSDYQPDLNVHLPKRRMRLSSGSKSHSHPSTGIKCAGCLTVYVNWCKTLSIVIGSWTSHVYSTMAASVLRRGVLRRAVCACLYTRRVRLLFYFLFSFVDSFHLCVCLFACLFVCWFACLTLLFPIVEMAFTHRSNQRCPEERLFGLPLTSRRKNTTEQSRESLADTIFPVAKQRGAGTWWWSRHRPRTTI